MKQAPTMIVGRYAAMRQCTARRGGVDIALTNREFALLFTSGPVGESDVAGLRRR